MEKTQKDKSVPKSETPFGRFEQLAKHVVTVPKLEVDRQGEKRNQKEHVS